MKYTNRQSSKSKNQLKNWVTFSVIMFTPRVMVIKMSKMAYVLYFLLMEAKSNSQFAQNIQVPLQNLIYILFTLESIFFLLSRVFYFSSIYISQTVTTKPMNQTISGRVAIKCFGTPVTTVLLSLAKNKKMSHF